MQDELTYEPVAGAADDNVDMGELEAWTEEVYEVAEQSVEAPWRIGDALADGEERFGELYAQAIAELEKLGYKPATLQSFLFVAKNIPDDVRREDTVGWSHHREVAGLTHQQQAEYLAACEEEQLSIKDLRERLKAAGLKKTRKGRAKKPCEGCVALGERVVELEARIAELQLAAEETPVAA